MAKTSKIILGLAAGAALIALWGLSLGAGSLNTAHAQATSTATLIVRKVVVNNLTSTFVPADFILGIAGTGVSSSTILGNASGTPVTLSAGAYQVIESSTTGITSSFSANCSGTIAAGETRTCIVTNTVLAGNPGTPNTGAGNPLIPASLALVLITGGTLAYFGLRKFAA